MPSGTSALLGLVAASTLTSSSDARAQACCAGGSAITPARLELLEFALVGLEAKAGGVSGSWDLEGHALALPRGAHEADLEQDAFGAMRVLGRGQVALLVPLIETWREAGTQSEFGGGLGDINASLRYDLTLAGVSRVVPGVAVLGGVTIPTGRPADASNLGALATGATGIGAWQLNFGIAIEQVFGPWLFNLTGLVAERTARTVGRGDTAVHEQLAPQWTGLVAAAYTFSSGWAVALSAAYAFEGEATIDDTRTPDSRHALPTLTLSTLVPLNGFWRLQIAVYDNPLVSQLGLNQAAAAGGSLTVIHSWM
ncbi:MAG: hypothetical protein FWD17_18840 [Polyangiaceae bacterium]|nr:hypothetical protein [Polyangiaceae bacterium]